ncbi:CRISPR-associated helicase Cas3' [Vibrio cholerae]|uniref:CRISPR-associated helicase Cas3' n=1 Tax=Vibrio cholerae TaxID=666 RepID=UPI00163C81C5|nr:CRISPR-associated helicase Cas3' [Vibrio cholerae]ELJ8515499.1 CRISPR-associated helicase Cas3' [Vibrio cholerae]
MRGRNKRNTGKIEISAIDFERCPAKTWQQVKGVVIPGRNVPEHCQIVGEIAKVLIQRFPPAIQRILFPVGSELAAACHDIGKVSPTFVAKIFKACGIDTQTLPALANVNPSLESQWGGHAGVSQATAEEIMAPKYVAHILGQHHGFSPSGVDDKRGNAAVFGGESWFEERRKLVNHLKEVLNTEWPKFERAEQARVVAGLTSVADWIGSGSFFEDPTQAWKPNVIKALNCAGFITPSIIKDLSFTDIFDPAKRNMKPREAQIQFVNQVTGPGVYVLEAQMGMGKTEAALYAAYRLLAEAKATGIYFALPTQLTSNKIYDRFNSFLEQIIAAETPNRALLLHSGAWLLKQADMGEEGSPGGAWFNHNKRGLLAPFAVGTIDQALMAVMNVKHGFVRAFGLAGKVVILDEVHSYDLYTGTILNELVAFLRQIGCTVIILSATLSPARRHSLLQRRTSSSEYPLITALHNDRDSPSEVAIPCVDGAKVELTHCSNDLQAIEEAINRAAMGQQVLWIENTVADAQQRYLDMASRGVGLGCEVGLLHSRFTPQDREKNEQHWVSLFGKAGWSQRRQCGRILIGTQVLEQSIDIDADFLITRFAPTDMLLQRIGRLWRHLDAPRATSARCECWLLAPNLEQALSSPSSAFGLSAMVYSPYVLCRSLEVWLGLSHLALPSSIRPLIDQTYCERDESAQWAFLLHQLKAGSRYKTGENALQALAKITLAKAGKTLPEHKADTRYSDQDTYEVLLLRAIRTSEGHTYIRLLDNRELTLPHARYQLSKAQWRELAVELYQSLVKVSPKNCPDKISKHQLEQLHLHHVFYLGNPEEDEALLRIALVSPVGELLTLDGRRASDKYQLEYRHDLGYRVIVQKE